MLCNIFMSLLLDHGEPSFGTWYQMDCHRLFKNKIMRETSIIVIMISALFIYSAYKVAVLDLSINKLQSGQDTPQTRMLLNVMKNLQFPSFKVLQVQCILWMVKLLLNSF